MEQLTPGFEQACQRIDWKRIEFEKISIALKNHMTPISSLVTLLARSPTKSTVKQYASGLPTKRSSQKAKKFKVEGIGEFDIRNFAELYKVGAFRLGDQRRMKTIIIAVGTALSLSNTAFAFEPRIEGLIGQYDAHNDICRGSSGDEKATRSACDSRGEVSMLLGREGLCYGKGGQAGYQMKWHKCGKGSIRQ
ncbi:hypothetical protein [Rhizobium sp. AN88]|uniref:hypothetical protein n=1 Tax=Rhizobium sp. AN88 TaxID=3035215 RepID=UPI002B25F2FA|nr:hypothetical protein [Rhizobium sp. AN88]